jgi:hypothetical protein
LRLDGQVAIQVDDDGPSRSPRQPHEVPEGVLGQSIEIEGLG